MATSIAAKSNRLAKPFLGRSQLARRQLSAVAALQHQNNAKKCVRTHDPSGPTVARRQALLGVALGVAALNLGDASLEPVLAKGVEKKAPTSKSPNSF